MVALLNQIVHCVALQKDWNIPNTTDDIQERAMANIYQMEVDRIKYALTCYLRTRIKKIERHARYISNTPEVHKLLSTKELEYLKGYLQVVDQCLYQGFLERLPQHLRTLADDRSSPSMIEEPNLEQFIFALVTVDVGLFHMDTGEDIDLPLGDLIVIRYKAVRQLVLDKKLQLV